MVHPKMIKKKKEANVRGMLIPRCSIVSFIIWYKTEFEYYL